MERSVLVTGAGSGVGLATVLHLSALGFRCVAAVPDAGEATALEAAARAAGAQVEILVFDLADEDARVKAVGPLRLYGLVNNAGYLNPGLLADVPSSSGRRQLEVMAVAPTHLVQLVSPFMAERREGRVVNVSSSVLSTAVPLMGWYRATKAALQVLTDAQRMELAHTGVQLVSVLPGGIDTPLWDRAEHDLRSRRERSSRPDVYVRALAVEHRTRSAMSTPDAVAEVIGTALSSGRPRRRYRVGTDARALGLGQKLVPEVLREAMSIRLAGLGAAR